MHTCTVAAQANKLKKEFKVPDKRFWWIKVKALAESRNWVELDRFAKSKKSPIGYEVGGRCSCVQAPLRLVLALTHTLGLRGVLC